MRENLVFIFGLILVVAPFLGVPESWRQYSIALIGVILLLIGYSQRRSVYYSQIDRGNGERGTDSFVETTEKLFDDSSLQ